MKVRITATIHDMYFDVDIPDNLDDFDDEDEIEDIIREEFYHHTGDLSVQFSY